MEITETLTVTTRPAWRAWLAEHHAQRSEIWLVTYRRATGRPSIDYNDAVEEALCFGWIDSVRKGLDEARLAQRFTPRRAGSGYSQTNLERLARLQQQGALHPTVLAAIDGLDPEAFLFPSDILAALQAVPEAWRFFQSTSAPYQRIRAAYVESARHRPADFQKRLRHLVEKSAQGKQFGYHIESFY